MITEKRFATSHGAFWRELLPTVSDYIRRRNLQLERFANHMLGGSGASRGLVNEVSFRLFERANALGVRPDTLDGPTVASAVEHAAAFIRRFRSGSRPTVGELAPGEIDEAKHLAARTRSFFKAEAGKILIWPTFPGCGWLDSAEGDVLGDDCLYEIKARDGVFRGQDIRQVVCYLALAHAAGGPSINKVCLVNPRAGTVLRDDVDAMCEEAGGSSSGQIFHELISYVSEPLWEVG